MKRNRAYSEATFDHEGNFDRCTTIEEREFFGEKPTQFEAPKDRKWQARNLVTIHWQLLGYPCPFPSMVYIFACVIDHANINNGRCDASQKIMAFETGYNVKTVRRVLEWVSKNTPFLEIEHRNIGRQGRFRSNAYHVNWSVLELYHAAVIAEIEEQKAAHRDASNSLAVRHQGGTRQVPPRGDTVHVPIKGGH